VRQLPIEPSLLARMRLVRGKEFVFSSRRGTPVNPGTALRRFIRPAADALGRSLGGWHDFRHTNDDHAPKRSPSESGLEYPWHSKVSLAIDSYDHANVEHFRQPLAVEAGELLPSVTQSGSQTF
jgi:hypothetical protein